MSVVMEGEGEEGDVALVKGQSRRRLWSFFAVHNVLVSRRLFLFNPESLCSCCSLWFVRDVGKKQRMKEGAVTAFAFSLP